MDLWIWVLIIIAAFLLAYSIYKIRNADDDSLASKFWETLKDCCKRLIR